MNDKVKEFLKWTARPAYFKVAAGVADVSFIIFLILGAWNFAVISLVLFFYNRAIRERAYLI